MEPSRIGGLPAPHHRVDRLANERRERRGKGSFQEAFQKQAQQQGHEPTAEPGHAAGAGAAATGQPASAPAQVQETGGSGRREPGDGDHHVDVLA